MQKSLKWKLLLLGFTLLFSGMVILPSFVSVSDWWKKYLAPPGMRLGLDLQGGMHLVLRVDLEKAIENGLDFAAQDLREALREKNITLVRTPSSDPKAIVFTLPNTGAVDTIKQLVTDDFPDLAIDVKAEEGTFPRINLRLKDDKIQFIKKNAVNQSLEIIRNRIDQFGVAEPIIIRQGADEIVVQLPGVKDPERALNLIGQTAQLEFKLVNDTDPVNLTELIGQAETGGQWKKGESRRKLNLALQSKLPADSEIYFEKTTDPTTKLEKVTPLLLKKQVLMTGEMVKDAQPRVGGTFNEPYVSLELTGRGGRVFGQVTEKSVGKRMAIVLDENIRSAPVIREKILGGSAQISGSFTFEEAADLAIVLRVGALPAPVDIIQNMTVGASLGQDSINKGLNAGLLGTALVVFFMIIYYRVSGVIANIGLVFNVLLLFVGLAMIGSTLTLPGIAGIILSIGMAVDSNIVIYERMREEFALGKSVKSGVEAGYEKAFWTIVDAHVTTLITALALFLFGTGPIKGFAVTLSLGVTINLFTTLFVTRFIYDFLNSKRLLKSFNFMQFIKKPNLDYMKIRNITFTCSALLALIGVFAFVQILRGHANLGVDFSGGTLLQFKASSSFSLDEVRHLFVENDLASLELQKVETEDRLIVKYKKSEEKVGDLSKRIEALLQGKYPDRNFAIESQSEIGSSVSEDLRNKAVLAVVLSLLGVVCYLGVRFDIRFGVAATIATFHDVLVVLGICYLMNIEMTLLIVTALLTLAGYSLNDTVIVFDRIREKLRKNPEAGIIETINVSTNEVLARTIVTSLTVFLTLVALFFFGGSVLHDFSFTLLIGVMFGTYSSVFIASPLLDVWRREPGTV